MAKLTLTDCYVKVNATDYASHVRSFTLKLNKDIPDATSVTDTWEAALSGMKSADGTIEFYQNFDSSVDAEIWSHFNGTSSVTIAFRPTSDAASASNPEYTGSAFITEYTPLGGSPGDPAMAPVSFKYTGTLSRSVA